MHSWPYVAFHETFERGMDVSLRAAWTYNGGTSKHALFTKVGDQIIDGNRKDQDDFYVIRANLVCSLQGTACY